MSSAKKGTDLKKVIVSSVLRVNSALSAARTNASNALKDTDLTDSNA